MNFDDFKEAVERQFNRMKGLDLFKVDISKDDMWDFYLGSFPEGSDPIFRERTNHDCQCCKSFIKRMGNVVAFSGGQRMTIWDGVVEDENYNEVTRAMSQLIHNAPLREPYLHYENTVGVDSNNALNEKNNVEVWTHFHVELPIKVVKPKDEIATFIGKLRSTKEVFHRGLIEITIESIDTVIELIDQKSLYKGDEYLRNLRQFEGLIKAFALAESDDAREVFLWVGAMEIPGSVTKIRNTSIGVLLLDLSQGKPLDIAVTAFEKMVAPDNYKRPKALVTKGMINKAREKVEELGLSESLKRRHAIPDDLTINNVLFADRSVREPLGDVFDVLQGLVAEDPQKFSKVEEVSMETFLDDILPSAETIEVLMENRHTANLFSLIAPVDGDAPNMLAWGNNFSWTYNGEITDSMREEVKARGGSVDGVLRFTHEWNHQGKNQSLMDLHVFMPAHTGAPTHGQIVDKYGTAQRVGWNNRSEPKSGGIQDVDHVRPPGAMVPLENITFPSYDRMPEGVYKLKIHNWQARNPNTQGFKAEIEVDGEIHQYEYIKAVKNKEWIDVADVTLKDGQFFVDHKLKASTAVQDIWGITTMTFQKCTMVMHSPNHWDGEQTGNMHVFFILEDCLQPGKIRGFFNEFLMDDLRENRKVFEHLGSQMRVEESEQQLSGVGFSTTQRNSVTLRVTGSFNRVIKVNF